MIIPRELTYKKGGLPQSYWDIRPLEYAKVNGLKKKFLTLVKGCKGVKDGSSNGIVVESKDIIMRPEFTAALFKYMMAYCKTQGWWIPFSDLTHKLRSTKFSYDDWDGFLKEKLYPCSQVLAIENMNAKTMDKLDTEEMDRLLDFYQKAFQCKCLVIISTQNNQNLFEKVIGEDLAELLSTKLEVWGKIG